MSGYNVLIHACESRMWYVDKYLMPSLYRQGIAPKVWVDHGKGNLESCLESFLNLPKNGSTWHLQDDVIICRNFAERIKYARGIVCGFYNAQFERDNQGMPYSFPCIRIPNKTALGFASWFNLEGREKYPKYAETGKMDDTFFHIYADEKGLKFSVANPCLVDHIDFLIGGSVANKTDKIHRAQWFDDELVEDLRRKITGSFF